ncbi:hypothetical protein [Streptomyces venezuelae]|uniref:hypothetical protein n=1 Tax=Streptomyces venezuelae TaxID=54571 RepID=UPI000309E4D4|nr:hypothetical protein [Streptomyces venezuelae]APE22926.1 hypothetical protein vnz_19270 [Streptomyces venezuelae]QES00306.1 hypothetical protein DEJ43_19535 [Streptomyces venezuelae ATCC 10712]
MTLAALATGCGGAGSDTTTKPATGGSAGTGSGSGGSAVGKADFGTVFRTEERFKQALPDPASMAGWTPRSASADIEEAPEPAASCGADADWYCARIARGEADYEAFGEEAQFDLTAFADEKAAQDACRKEKSWSAKYTKAGVAPVAGVESHAYYRNAGSLDGLYLTLCLGTTVAQVTLEGEGSSLDPATAHSLAQIFVPRIQKAAAAS